MNDAKRAHKFRVDQSVSLQSTIFNRDAARGAYKVHYPPGEPYEPVVSERDLSEE